MPLLDHFHPPLHPHHHWESFFSNWATRIADLLNDDWLSPEYLAGEYMPGSGRPEPDSFEVRVFTTTCGRTLVGAIELVSPGNKDRPGEVRAFATKCASYLHQGISLVIIDIVTNRRANLHNETIRLLNAVPHADLPPEAELYAVSYRPVLRQDRPEIDLWMTPCVVGRPLPAMPLRLTGDLFVQVDFEASYQEACRRRRLA